MTHPSTSRSRLAAVAAISIGGLATLIALPGAPHTERAGRAASALPDWLWSLPTRSVDPVELLAAGARLVATVVLAYLALIAIANLLASFVPTGRRRTPAWRMLQALTPRWLAVASIGVVLGAGPVSAQQPGAPVDRPAPVMEVVGATTSAPATTTVAPATSSTITLDRPAGSTTSTRSSRSMPGGAAGPAPTAEVEAPVIDPASPLQPVTDPAAVDGPLAVGPASSPDTPSADQLPPPASVHRVQPGEHFWSIAQQVVIERDGPTASDVAVAAYWRTLVEVNRDRLVDPGNPDLILPGQILDLPL